MGSTRSDNTARDFVDGLAESLSLPDIYLDIRGLLMNSVTRIEDFVAVVDRDPALAERVRRVAGSDYFGFPRRCDSLYQAISLIGLMQLHDMLLGSLCMRRFSRSAEPWSADRAFWHYSVRCGIAARAIGQYCRVDAHPVFFNLGLLHEIGRGAIFVAQPDAVVLPGAHGPADESASIEAERERLGFDYTEVGAELARLWRLPPVYRQATAHHLHPERADKPNRAAVEAIHLAHVICRDPHPGRHHAVIRRAIDQVAELARLPVDIDAMIVEQTDAHADAVLDLLWSGLSDEGPDTTRFRIDA